MLPRQARREATLHLPEDLVLGREFDAGTEIKDLNGIDVPEGWMGLDIGTNTAAKYAKRIEGGGTIFWNGPMGAFELPPVRGRDQGGRRGRGGRRGPHRRRRRRLRRGAGRSSGSATTWTGSRPGGGASLELLEGKELPGVEALPDA